MKEVVIKTQGLCKSFSGSVEQNVLNNVDLEFYKGDFTVIMGASGAGKSTLMYALSGMDTPTSGNVIFCGENISGYGQDKLAVFRRDHCGFVFQQIYLIEGMTATENVLTAGLLVNKDKRELLKRANELLETLDISEDSRKKFPSQLSGGQAQRVGIARALINSPQVLFADEPTGALNSSTGTDVLDALTRFNAEGQSVVMVTHDIKSARRGNRILYLKDGSVMDECDLGVYNGEDEARNEKLSAFLKKMGW